MREQTIDGAFEIAAVMGDGARQIFQHLLRDVEAGMMGAGRGDARLENAEPQFFAKRTHFHDKTTGEPRTHAIIQAFEIGRRAIGCDHDLTAGIDQRVQGVTELGLGGFALQELQIVDHEHVDAAQCFLEGQRRLGLQRRDKAVHEFFGRQIQHLALAAGIAGPGHRLQQMGFAETHAGMDIERVEHHGIAAAAFGHLACSGVRQRVRTTDDEACKCQARIERRAAERIVVRRNRRGRYRAQLDRRPAVRPFGTARVELGG